MNAFFLAYAMMLLVFFIPAYADSHHPQEFLTKIKGTQDEGEQIYKHFCVNCHAQKPIIPLGAPKIGDEDDWKLRVKQGLNVLFQHSDQGFNAMPPRGGCFECSDRQLALSIITMVPKDSQKDLLIDLKEHNKYKE